jgi:hypothetical protein
MRKRTSWKTEAAAARATLWKCCRVGAVERLEQLDDEGDGGKTSGFSVTSGALKTP